MPADPAEPDRDRAALRALFAAQLRQDAAELTELAGRRSTEIAAQWKRSAAAVF